MTARRYRLVVGGQLGQDWAEWFEPLTIHHPENQVTLLEGELADQAALHGVLNKVFALGLTLIAVNRLEEDSAVQMDSKEDQDSKQD
ncbi:MAG: hypothetical protein DCC55_15640 [Chloroflexi bacterium]|nr:MAG: hypothetical protein DCC55_15640 [Chloroflexota bacterium]